MHVKTLLFGKKPGVFGIGFGVGRGLRIHTDPQTNSQRILGLAEAEVGKCFREFARKCVKYVELGASDGYYSMVVRRENAGAEIIACEPQPHYAEIARKNFAENGLSEEKFAWRVEYGGTDQLPLANLAAAEGFVFLKIDIDGGELEALRTMGDGWNGFKGAILLEVHSEELKTSCRSLLEAAGFRCMRIPQAWWRLFVPERRPLKLNEWIIATK